MLISETTSSSLNKTKVANLLGKINHIFFCENSMDKSNYLYFIMYIFN